MIISVRGPSGAGKSFLAERVMAAHDGGVLRYAPDHKLPVGIAYSRLFVLGRYDVRAAGADAVPVRNWPRDELFEFIRRQGEATHVLFEGMAISNEVTRTASLGVRVIGLTTSPEDCAAAAEARRDRTHVQSNGPGIAVRHRELERVYTRLQAAGVVVERLDREAAYCRVLKLLEG